MECLALSRRVAVPRAFRTRTYPWWLILSEQCCTPDPAIELSFGPTTRRLPKYPDYTGQRYRYSDLCEFPTTEQISATPLRTWSNTFTGGRRYNCMWSCSIRRARFAHPSFSANSWGMHEKGTIALSRCGG